MSEAPAVTTAPQVTDEQRLAAIRAVEVARSHKHQAALTVQAARARCELAEEEYRECSRLVDRLEYGLTNEIVQRQPPVDVWVSRTSRPSVPQLDAQEHSVWIAAYQAERAIQHHSQSGAEAARKAAAAAVKAYRQGCAGE